MSTQTTPATQPTQSPEACATCPAFNAGHLTRLGIDTGDVDHILALAGNPNTGKSTVFNALTGLRQHTGNWPGKTVTRAEGAFAYADKRYRIVDLPGTYSLLSTSADEEVARDFILFGKPDVTVIVVDGTRLERNLNLVLQVLEITDRAVLCVNLMDEARRHKISVDDRMLARDLGIPVVLTAARQREGIDALLQAVANVASGAFVCKPHRVGSIPASVLGIVERMTASVSAAIPGLPNARWVALRLLEGDQRMMDAVSSGELLELRGREREPGDQAAPQRAGLLREAHALRLEMGEGYHDALMEGIYEDAARIADRAVTREGNHSRFSLDRTIDKLVTSKWTGFPIMLLLLATVFWLTVQGANIPSGFLSWVLVDQFHPVLKQAMASIGSPSWLTGVLIDGAYLAGAWVVSVMLPPMMIFFPVFTLLEDFGYLPRVAFNMDALYRAAGAHGKQALTMTMGFGCNAAGVVATRIIDSPRERLIAIITNNFSLCNGRWPTQILMASLFVGVLAPPHLAGIAAAGAVVVVALLGVVLSLAVSWSLSRSVLRGEASAFSLELPPYRPPRIMQTLYTSLIDRTMFVLWRAIVFAVPAGVVIWLVANVTVGDITLAEHFIRWTNPFGLLLGLNGVILLAYVIAIPANEIVIPTVLMLTVLTSTINGVGAGAGVMFEADSALATAEILRAGGWTSLTGICLMLFSLLHNPCSTTVFTIFKETRSAKWTAVATLLPLGMGFAACFAVAQIWHMLGGG
jgi:ferrous iron transport protein B